MTLSVDIAVRRGDLDLDVAFETAAGQTVAVLGPNGAGKTTLLKVLAGLLRPDRGEVVLDGEVLDLPPQRRSVGVAFQDHLLFPHLSALDNVAFGLRARGMRRGEARARALQWLERLAVAAARDRRPRDLSGGEAQRVALARALVTEPRLLLLDEPMSALDVSTRAEVRRDLRRHLAEHQGTRLVVTHDPLEAMVLADRMVILEQGRIIQSGTPEDVRAHPRSAYVADLAGVNLFTGEGRGDHVELEGGAIVATPATGAGPRFVVIRPQSVSLHRRQPEGTPRNVWRGAVAGVDLHGDRVRVTIDGSPRVVAEVTAAAALALGLADGGDVWAAVKATDVVSYPA